MCTQPKQPDSSRPWLGKQSLPWKFKDSDCTKHFDLILCISDTTAKWSEAGLIWLASKETIEGVGVFCDHQDSALNYGQLYSLTAQHGRWDQDQQNVSHLGEKWNRFHVSQM